MSDVVHVLSFIRNRSPLPCPPVYECNMRPGLPHPRQQHGIPDGEAWPFVPCATAYLTILRLLECAPAPLLQRLHDTLQLLLQPAGSNGSTCQLSSVSSARAANTVPDGRRSMISKGIRCIRLRQSAFSAHGTAGTLVILSPGGVPLFVEDYLRRIDHIPQYMLDRAVGLCGICHRKTIFDCQLSGHLTQYAVMELIGVVADPNFRTSGAIADTSLQGNSP